MHCEGYTNEKKKYCCAELTHFFKLTQVVNIDFIKKMVAHGIAVIKQSNLSSCYKNIYTDIYIFTCSFPSDRVSEYQAKITPSEFRQKGRFTGWNDSEKY